MIADSERTRAETGGVVRGWFHDAFDSMGYRAVPSRWGTYWDNGQVYVSELDSADVGDFLDNLKERYAGQERPVSVYLDNADDLKKLGPLLREKGCGPPLTSYFLAHTDSGWQAAAEPDFTLEHVTVEGLQLFAETKLRAWKSEEGQPSEEEIKAEMERRSQELAGSGRGLLAFLESEPLGYIWWHEDPSLILWVNQIATRTPFRRRGVARSLLSECIHSAYERGYRALVLDVAESNQAALKLYRSLGFTELVYKTYEFEFATTGVDRNDHSPAG